MLESAFIPNRFIAIFMAMIIPFCCCTLDLCAQSADQGAVSSCCCNSSESSCPDQEQIPSGNCSGCIKAPATTAPDLDTDALSWMSILHPAEIAITPVGLMPTASGIKLLCRACDDPGSDPGFSARILRCQLTPQI